MCVGSISVFLFAEMLPDFKGIASYFNAEDARNGCSVTAMHGCVHSILKTEDCNYPEYKLAHSSGIHIR